MRPKHAQRFFITSRMEVNTLNNNFHFSNIVPNGIYFAVKPGDDPKPLPNLIPAYLKEVCRKYLTTVDE